MLRNNYNESTFIDFESLPGCELVLRFVQRNSKRCNVTLCEVDDFNNVCKRLEHWVKSYDSKVPCTVLVAIDLRGANAIRKILCHFLVDGSQFTIFCDELREGIQEEPKAIEKTGPFLTSAHVCHHCADELVDNETSISADGTKATIDCPSCKCRTSVYSIFHHCVQCSSLLESPAATATKKYTCPKCDTTADVPSDLLVGLNEVEGDEFFGIECHGCCEKWAARQSDAESLTVCRVCNGSMTIPISGEFLEPEKQFVTTTRRCQNCNRAVPTRATSCPICETKLA